MRKSGASWIAAGILASAAAFGGEPAPAAPGADAGRFVYAAREVDRTDEGKPRQITRLVSLRADGTEIGRSEPIEGFPVALRPSPSGGLLWLDAKGISERSADGKTAWELSFEETDLLPTSLDLLPSGRFAVLGMSRSAQQKALERFRELQAEMRKEIEGKAKEDSAAIAARYGAQLQALCRERPAVVIEVDRKGKTVRRVPVQPEAFSVRVVGNDRLLLAGQGSLRTIGWDGQEVSSVPLGEGTIGYDAHPQEAGTFLVVVKRLAKPGEDGKPSDRNAGLAEIDAKGKTLWEAPHGCPTGIQELPNGHVLVKGG